MRRLALFVLALLALVLAVGPQAASAAGAPQAHCSPAPEDCTGWYRSDVTVTWTWDAGGTPLSCTFMTVSADTTGTSVGCTVSYNGTPFTTTVPIKRDATPPVVSGASPARAPDAEGWYNHALTVAFVGSDATSGIASCSRPTHAGGDGAAVSVVGTCTDVAGNTSTAASFGFKYDATAPAVTVTPARPPDRNGWYNREVAFGASGADATSGVAACSGASYAGPDSAAAAVGLTCRDRAGNTSAPAVVSLKYDATAPAVTGELARKPDANGWYNRPVALVVKGTDATSGVASCTGPRYAGPDGAKRELRGSCVDAAGNASAQVQATVRYDDTPPKLRAITAETSGKLVRIGWTRTADVAVVQLVRTPGVAGARRSVVYRGKARAFADRSVRAGVQYRYVLYAADAAGNVVRKAVATGPRPALYLPAPGAVVAGGLRLAWKPAPGAAYYNVQLHRGGAKVLSAWPRAPTLALGRTWRYEGRSQRLLPGRYRWYVWPAHGSREQPSFGRPLGSSTFVVR